MSHAAIQAQLSDYLEGDVSFAERGVIDAHLARCRLCAREFEELRRTVELLRSLPTPRPAAGLAAAVFRRLEQGEGRRSWIAQLGSHLADFGLTPAALPLSALAAVALVIGVVGLPDLPISTSSLWADAEFSEKSDLVPKSPASSSAARSGARSGQNLRSESRVAPATRSARSAAAPLAPIIPAPIHEAALLWPRPPRPAWQTDLPSLLAAPARVVPVASGSAGPGNATLAGFELSPSESFSPGSTGEALALDKARGRLRELDRRLDFLLIRPGDFAREFRLNSVAAQELWAVELVERAMERGIVEDALEALRGGGFDAQEVVGLFARSIQRADAGTGIDRD